MRPKLPGTEALKPFMEEIENRRIYSNFGPLNQRLIEQLASHFNVVPQSVLLVTNGTLGIQSAIATSSPQNSVWSLPTWTFVATAQAAISAGVKFQLEDPNSDTWMINSCDIRGTDGVIPVTPFGKKPNIQEWVSESKKRPVIIDAASCFDSCNDLSMVQHHNIAVMVSLHATKLVSTGEGGVMIGPENWITQMKKWINFGFHGDRIAKVSGANAKMSEFNCAVGLASLSEWSKTREQWAIISSKMIRILETFDIAPQISFSEGNVSSTLVGQVQSAEIKMRIVETLKLEEIETRDWWASGLHQMPIFCNSATNNFPNADNIAAKTIGFPLYLDMTNDDLNRVKLALQRSLSK